MRLTGLEIFGRCLNGCLNNVTSFFISLDIVHIIGYNLIASNQSGGMKGVREMLIGGFLIAAAVAVVITLAIWRDLKSVSYSSRVWQEWRDRQARRDTRKLSPVLDKSRWVLVQRDEGEKDNGANSDSVL